MKSLQSLALVVGLFVSSASFAQAPAGAPAGSTGQCKDGSYTTHETKKGACSGHKGVKDWYGESAAATKTTAAAPAATPAEPPPAKAASNKMASTAPAPGGGAGQVWVNTESHVYHCQGTKWYGKTKQGQYLTESAAMAAGAHADHGKACAG